MLKLIKWIGLIVLICAIIFLIVWSVSILQNPAKLPVTQVVVEGTPELTQNEVQAIITPNLNAGLLKLKIDSMQLKLQKLPWVSSVEIMRLWPDKLKVMISPQHVVAYWNDKYFLNQYMEVIPLFADSTIPENLPKLYGPMQSQVKAGYYYQILSLALTSLNLFIIQLKLAENGDISLLLDNGIIIQLGQQHVLTRLNHFVKVYAKVFGGQKDLSGDVVDLRYPSGMAVRWGSS